MEFKDKLLNHLNFKNGKRKPKSNGIYPVYGGNGIFNSSQEFNQVDSIIIGRVGAYCGSVYYSKGKCWVSDNAISANVKNSDKSDIEYFYYLLKSLNLNNRRVGTSQPLLNQDILKNIIVNIFDINTQKKISSILSNLDKKIEVNNKIIGNLEEQAQAIFKSWFVDFEPFQDGNFVESEIGMIPEGWEVKKLGKSRLGKIIGSGIDEFSGEKIYLATADVSDTNITNISTKISFEDRPSRANMQPIPKSVWFAKMKDSRKLILVDDIDKNILDNMIFSTGFAGIKANNESIYYLWTYIISEEFDKIKNSYCEGTTMQAINNKNINKILIKVPSENVLKEYNKIVEPSFKSISILRIQNKKFEEIRDSLLPRLMSGEIDLSDLDLGGEVLEDE